MASREQHIRAKAREGPEKHCPPVDPAPSLGCSSRQVWSFSETQWLVPSSLGNPRPALPSPPHLISGRGKGACWPRLGPVTWMLA